MGQPHAVFEVLLLQKLIGLIRAFRYHIPQNSWSGQQRTQNISCL